MNTLIFDTETTGLNENILAREAVQPHITEIYCVLQDDHQNVISEIDELINPGVKIPEEVTKITKIDDLMVSQKRRFDAFADRIEALISAADEIVAHNLAFDMRVVDTEFARLGRKIQWPARKVCTVEATQHWHGYRLNLGALHFELFGEQFYEAHRARNDVAALARCFWELREREEL